MTCVDVMYQPPGPPGAAFQAYPRETCSLEFSIRRSQALSRMQEPLDLGISSTFSPAATAISPLTNANSTFKISTGATGSPTSQVSQTSVLTSNKTHTSSYPEHGRSPSSSLSSLTPPSSSTEVFHQHSNSYSTNQYHLPQYFLPQNQSEQKLLCQRLTNTEKDKHRVNDEEQELCPMRADYLGVNCVLNTFFSGDVRKAVDDHFTKSMDTQVRQQRSSDGEKSTQHQGSLPMAERNLPPSFWNSSYYQQHPQHNYHYSIFDHNGSSGSNYNFHQHYPYHALGADGSTNSSFGTNNNNSGAHNANILLGGSSSGTSSGAGFTSGMRTGNDLSAFHSHPAHPYFSPALQGLSNLQSAVTSDPWSAYCNSFASPATAVPYPHRPVPYDISGYSSSGRFGQKYSSFLMQPSSVRSSHFGAAVSGHCDGQKSSDFSSSSRSRYSDHRLSTDYSTGHHSSFATLDTSSFQDVTTKELSWF